MSDSTAQLDGLDLKGLDSKGKPAPARLTDVKAAIGIFAGLMKADEKSAINRARIDSMFDGAAPYNAAQLTSTGQGLKTNLNFGEAQRMLDIALSAYVDLYSSLEYLVDVRMRGGERSNEARDAEEIIAAELTGMFRRWPEFHTSYLRLCTQFIKHGVGVAYFDSPEDWRFRAGGFADILIPRQAQASEGALDISIGRRQYHLHELYHFIKNPKAAAKVGWNVAEVKRVMMKNVKTSGRASANGTTYSDYEALQAEIKNNDLYTGYQNPTVDVLHYWVREIDGRVSHYISAESEPENFMFQKVGRYASPEQAYVFFTHGVGSNGTYHSVRGLGQRIFAHIQTSNRLRCQQIDGAMLASSVMIQPENHRSMEELEFTFYGAYAVMSPNVNIIEKAIPNLGTAVRPALEDLGMQLAANTDTQSIYGAQQSSPYRNQTQVVADMDVATRISGSTLNLFYASWTRLLREMVRRVVTDTAAERSRDPAIRDFFARCLTKGVTPDLIQNLDADRTKAVRSIGNGSSSDRLVSLRELQGISGQLDDVGRRNLTRDIVSSRVGNDLVDRYAPAEVEDRPSVDTKIAMLENQHLQEGGQVPVVSSELHGQHLGVHLPMVQQMVQAVNEGQIDPEQVFPALQAIYQHLSETAQYAAGDPALAPTVAHTKQVLQYVEELISNTAKAMQKDRREGQEGQEGQGGPPDESVAKTQADIQLKEMKAQSDMMITQQKAELDMAIKKKRAEQDMALTDAKQALDFRIDTQDGRANHPVPERTPYTTTRVRER